MSKFEGSIVALVTPFTKSGRVDVRKIHELVRWHLQEGSQGIVCAGSTGESTALNEKERAIIIRACVEAAERKILILAGTGVSDTRQSVRLTEAAQRLGAEGAMIIAPYFNKASQRGCILHFKELSRIGLPLIVYNNPARCVINLQPETLAEIVALPNIAALKEANGDPNHFAKVRFLTNLPILAGEDCLTYDMLSAGAVGAVSVVGNLLPKLWSDMIFLFREGKKEKAKELFVRVKPLLGALALEANPQCVKKALALMGLCSSALRLPLLEPTEENSKKIRNALAELCLPFGRVKSLKTGSQQL